MISKKDVLRVTETAFDALYTSGGQYGPEECEATRHDAVAVKDIVLDVLRKLPTQPLRRTGVSLEFL